VPVVCQPLSSFRAVAEQCGLSLTDADVESFRADAGSVDAYNLARCRTNAP